MNNPENIQEIWQVEVNGEVYEAPLDEFKNWILEGAINPTDKVRRGNLRWLEAGKVPLLFGVFQQKLQNGGVYTQPISNVQTVGNVINKKPDLKNSADFYDLNAQFISQQFQQKESENIANSGGSDKNSVNVPSKPATIIKANVCFIHSDTPPVFVCDGCAKVFCKACPKTYSSVRICPICGEMCKLIVEVNQKTNRQRKVTHDLISGFGIGDLAKALIYPFKKPVSFFIGGLLTAILSIGLYLGMLSAAYGLLATGIAAVLLCGLSLIALVFGSSFKVINQVSQGDYEAGFSLSSEDFSLYDNILHPAFLGIGTFIITWAPMMIVVVFAVWSITNSMQNQKQVNPIPVSELQNSTEIVTGKPELSVQTGNSETELDIDALIKGNDKAKEAAAMQKINQLESASRGASMPSVSQEQAKKAIIEDLLKKALPFFIGIVLAGLWAFLYFPLALMVAGYTDSLGSTLNPLIGLDTARNMGFTFVKAFLSYVVILVICTSVYRLIQITMSPFGDESGNLPAQFISSFVSFYLYLSIGCLLGLAMYKSSDKLGIKVS